MLLLWTALACCALLTGCHGVPVVGALQAQSLSGDPVVLPGRYVAAFYGHGPQGETSIVLSSDRLEPTLSGGMKRGQLLHIDLLWLPKPGTTPLDRTATNASIRHVVVADGEVGVYVGAGFAMPQQDPGGKTLTIDLRSATLNLQDSTPGFIDRLSPVELTGRFTAGHDERATAQMHRAMTQLVTNALGRVRYVSAEGRSARNRPGG